MWRKIRQALCRHRFYAPNTLSYYDSRTDTCTITETCIKCGKRFSFRYPMKTFLGEVQANE